ncbi:MAG: ATP-dependent DNA helicase SCO5184 [uncultured Propionibacteriaceae bacterium]|uniref:DNA 3'-5' helicase n=1 Tax=uncultured Propionibacteriaceae bacterium TaxID=257457 RepID=A0A6J4NKJ8_9ACTN|nr:MAG: ATP-dependent DNA helicase SCO5184 [uncultured Propionibacteriaceae bacterium]
MTVHTLTPPAPTRRLRDADDLIDALRVPFSAQQLAAITAPLEPGVIIAGAGSGKTTVMAARVVWLVGTGAVRPEEVLGLTFTRKAAAELSQRVRSALLKAGVISDRGVDESGEQLIMTYDAFAARLVAEHGLRLGYEADPTMISGATRYRLASRVVKAAAGPFEFISRLRPGTVTERVLKLDSDLQQHLVHPKELDRHARDFLIGLRSAPLNSRGNVYADVKNAIVTTQERLEIASLVQDYQRLKQRLGLVEFADQMAIAARLASEVPEVSTALRSAFAVVLLDEYQDTSAAQAIMLRGLFSGHTPSQGMGHPVTAVGDPFQAIYGWRGAAASNIVQFAEEFRTVDGRRSRQFALTVNRRSGHTILDVANVLSRPLRTGQTALLPGDGATNPDEQTAAGLGILQAPSSAGPGRVQAATFDTWEEEVRWICDQILTVRADGVASRWADIAVLSRRNADIGSLYGELVSRDIPVEIVGLGGLLTLPEVMDVTATLRLVDDVTANPDLIRLLTGPRWRVGARDLALLGRRARELAHHHDVNPDREVEDRLLTALEGAVADVDPTEVVCLLDALESPGEGGYSAAGLDRFAALAAELAYLRRHCDEPLLDLTRRVIATLGLDVELMSTPELNRTARRDQLGAFVDAVADYVDVDGDASLAGLLSYLQAEIDQGNGLDQAMPSDREAVKLLTVHKAKGLEWEVVFLPALMKGVFPSDRVTDNWVSNAAVLPGELRGDAASVPQLTDATSTAMADYKKQLRAQQLLAEDRLAYVAATRAKQLLVGTGHWWRADLVNARVPASYLTAIQAEAELQGQLLAEAAPPGTSNPLVTDFAPRPWPSPLDADALARRQASARLVSEARERYAKTGSHELPPGLGEQLLLDGEEIVASWDADIDRLLAETVRARQVNRVVPLPQTLSASALLRLNQDPASYAADLARPMPHPPSPAARFGTRFHQWVERHFAGGLATGGIGQQQLVDPDDLPDRADAGSSDEAELRQMCERFAAGQFGHTVPYALEAPVSLMVAGRLVRGRIDAIYDLRRGEAATSSRHQYLVVDWKTTHGTADPLQLSIYRLAWAEVCGVDVEEVDAAFYYVRADRLARPRTLLDRAGIEAIMMGGNASRPKTGPTSGQ